MTLGPRAVRSRVGLPVVNAHGQVARSEPAPPSSYYDIPFLKAPTWDWRVASYFFLESVSSGAFLIAALADLVGDGRHEHVRRAGRYIAFAAFVPCAPFLIWDLGRPERFLHMLRIFKRSSPMSHGSWALTAYSAPLGALTIAQVAEDMSLVPRLLGRLMPERIASVLGVPAALMLATYPGVLLSTTANPLWSQTRLLGALFACSAVHAGAASVALALRDAHTDERARIERIAAVASAAEAALLGTVVVGSGRQARSLLTGRMRILFLFGAVGAGILFPALLRAIAPKSGRLGRFARIAATVLSLVGSFALKLSFVYAGHSAARDARASHDAARQIR